MKFHPASVSGAAFSLSIFLFIDGFLIAQKETPENHFTFVLWIPLIISMLAFFFINLSAPDQISDEGNEKALGSIFVGWCLAFGSSVCALAMCASFFVNSVDRKAGFPGVAIVGQTLLIALSASALWASKRRRNEWRG